MVPVNSAVQIRLEVGSLETGAGGWWDWGVMLWGVGVCDAKVAAVFCNGIQMLDVCVLDDPVCRWLDVGWLCWRALLHSIMGHRED